MAIALAASARGRGGGRPSFCGRTKKTRVPFESSRKKFRVTMMKGASLAAACRCCRSAQRLSVRTRKDKRNLQIGSWTLEPSGTLDPLASGVLVIGVGKGTKELQRYENAAVNVMLDSGREACIRSLRPLLTHMLILCLVRTLQHNIVVIYQAAKRYTARGEFGFETTTLDMDEAGKVTKRAPFDHVTVEALLYDWSPVASQIGGPFFSIPRLAVVMW
jgi:hypothetical protein